MGRSSSFQLKKKAMILNYPVKAWCALSTENKLKVWAKVYDKEMPAKTENKHEGKYEVKIMPPVLLNGKPLSFNV